jgi:hypothetical protein
MYVGLLCITESTFKYVDNKRVRKNPQLDFIPKHLHLIHTATPDVRNSLLTYILSTSRSIKLFFNQFFRPV